MAKAPAATPDDPFKALSEEANERLAGCRAQKREFDLDIRESYFFAAPHRAREIRSEQAPRPTKPTDAAELQTGIAMELSKDFSTVIVNSFMPPAEPWAERRPGMFVPKKLSGEIKEQIKEGDDKIFEGIRASNLYEEIPKAFNPDLAVGTVALWIDDPRPAENVVVQAIPLRELEINVGPFGENDDRFVVRHTKNRHVKALLGKTIYEKLPKDIRDKIDDEKQRDQSCEIRWGFWRLWDRMADVVWKHVVMVADKVVHETELTGEGSCPLIVMRFNPSPEWAYGQGPLPESLPDLRQLDDLEAKKVEHIDMQLAPPTGYPDDSFAAVENGVESGKMYPLRPGSHEAVKRIFPEGKIEAALFETAEAERRLRHRFFLDWPEQRGDTPPTATQWLDEMQMAQRRIGTPGASFWKEGPAQIFLRFKYILEKRGLIEPVTVNGKQVSLQPYNPAQRAAEQQEVAMAARFIQIGAGAFPEEYRISVDGQKTLEKIKEKMRANLIVFRSEADKKLALERITALMEGRQQLRPAEPAGAGQL